MLIAEDIDATMINAGAESDRFLGLLAGKTDTVTSVEVVNDAAVR